MAGGGFSGIEVRREVHSRRTAAFEARRLLLEGLVGLEVVYVGQATESGTPAHGELYPEWVGYSCRIVEANYHVAHCPLVIELRDGRRGIAEPDWLMEIQ